MDKPIDKALLKVLVDVLLEHITEGIHVTDCQGRTIYYNDVAGKIDGICPETAIGQHILKMFPSLNQDTSTVLQALQGIIPGNKQIQRITNMYGSTVYLESTTLPLKQNEKIIGAVDISRDVTKVKELAEKVVELQSEVITYRHKTRPKGEQEQARFVMDDIVGKDPKLAEIKYKALRAARTSSPVLVWGETGTGKELLVQGIHNASPRRNSPFISQNCAALPVSLMEGILFGTVKGSFTGAENRPGLVELADGGTLLLDEITCLDVELQSKLLRFIQDGFVRRLGDSDVHKVNVRIIASTNIDPQAAVNANTLRADLYYRLNVVNLELPPLRERREDILYLASYILHDLNKRLNMEVKGFTPEVEGIFLAYAWPGNIRELRAVIEGAMNTLDADYLAAEHLPIYIRKKRSIDRRVEIANLESLPLQSALSQVEEELISRALVRSDYNVSKAARLLGVPRQTLQYKLRGRTAKTDNRT